MMGADWDLLVGLALVVGTVAVFLLLVYEILPWYRAIRYTQEAQRRREQAARDAQVYRSVNSIRRLEERRVRADFQRGNQR